MMSVLLMAGSIGGSLQQITQLHVIRWKIEGQEICLSQDVIEDEIFTVKTYQLVTLILLGFNIVYNLIFAIKQ